MMLTIYYQNVRGLRSKTHNIRINSLNCEYDVICLTETFLNASVFDREVLSDEYCLVRRDRDLDNHVKSDGGGVLIGIRNSFKFIHRPEWSTSAEDIWITIIQNPDSNIPLKLHVCCVYIPPQDYDALSIFLNKLILIVDSIPNEKILICGDFNLPLLNWDRREQNVYFSPMNTYNAYSTNFVDIMAYCGLKQFNGEKNFNNRILDLILSNLNIVNISACSDPLTRVDLHHPPLLIQLDFDIMKNLGINMRSIFNFKKADYSSLNAELSCVSWDANFKDLNTEEMINTFYNILDSLINLYVPRLKVKSKSYPNWYSYELIKLIKKKYKIHRLFKKYKNDMYYMEFSKLRKQVKFLLHKCYKEYLMETERQIPLNIKKFWAYVSSFKKNRIPQCMEYNGTISSNGEEITNMFARHFHTMFSSLTNDDNMTFRYNTNINLSSITICETEVVEIILKLNENLGSGTDGIPSIFVKSCLTSLSYPLTLIYNKSLSEGYCPSIWKKALVVPIFKSGHKNNVENYRPISKLCIFEKIFEKIIYKTLFMTVKNILIREQFGFIPGRSAESGLVQYTDDIWKSMENRHQVDSVYTDFSKAFDRINHNILIKKLEALGIRGSLLKWFGSYLVDRYQATVVNGYQSKFVSVSSGVPQGSHLGPLLFIIFVNDIAQCFRFAKFSIYADDLKIYSIIRNTDDCYSLQSDLDRLSHYVRMNGLSLNIKKCSVISFTRNRNEINFKYNIAQQELNKVASVRDLGVVLDSKLIFDTHIDLIVKKSFKMLGFLLRIGKRFSNASTFVNLYNTLVRPHLEYASVCWSPHYQIHINRIESVQKRFFHFINRKFPNFTLTQLSLEKRRTYFDFLFLYKIINNCIDASHILERFGFRVPSRETRSNDLFTLWQCRTNASMFSPINRICITYNNFDRDHDLPDLFSCSLVSFKRKIKGVLYNT